MSVQMTCCNTCFRKRPISSAAPSGVSSVGFAHGDAAADGASGSCREDVAERRAAFDAAAVLDFEPRACGDAFEHFQVGRTLRPGAVQIDHVQPQQPRRFEAQGRVERVAAVGRAAVVVALCESHAGAVDQIHRGNDFDIHLISVLGSCVESGCPPPRSFRGGTACRRSCRVRVPR